MLNQCHIGDCRTLLKAMAAAGVRAQMCVTSPPYWGLRDYGVPGQIGMEATWVRYVARLRSVFRLVWDLLADDGTLWLNLGDSYNNFDKWGGGGGNTGKQTVSSDGSVPSWAVRKRRRRQPGLKAKDLVGIPWRVAFSLQADGWYLRSDIIWHKPNPMPESVTDRPTKAHEYLFLLAKSDRYYYDAEAIAEPSIHAGETRITTAKGFAGQATGLGVRPTGNAKPGSIVEIADTRNKRSVWSVSSQPFDGAHFATFPPSLIEPCILAGSRSGDVVLDPFMGSGTTAQVAEHLGRQWIGCELNPDYMPLQALRLQQRAMAF